METASDYRELVTQQLRTGMSDIITLDLGKLSSKGITLGSSFQVDNEPCSWQLAHLMILAADRLLHMLYVQGCQISASALRSSICTAMHL